MIEDFFNHKCDIYHINEAEKSPGYGLAGSPSFSYGAEPDVTEQQCHFCVKSQAVSITQHEPMTLMDARIKLVLPAGTDVRLNDKIVNCDTKHEYIAELPNNIRDHHIFVYVKKVERQKAL